MFYIDRIPFKKKKTPIFFKHLLGLYADGDTGPQPCKTAKFTVYLFIIIILDSIRPSIERGRTNANRPIGSRTNLTQPSARSFVIDGPHRARLCPRTIFTRNGPRLLRFAVGTRLATRDRKRVYDNSRVVRRLFSICVPRVPGRNRTRKVSKGSEDPWKTSVKSNSRFTHTPFCLKTKNAGKNQNLIRNITRACVGLDNDLLGTRFVVIYNRYRRHDVVVL